MKYFLFILIISMGPVSHALTVGIQSVNPTVSYKGADGLSMEGKNEFGFSADFLTSFPIDSTFSIVGGLGLAQKNISIRMDGSAPPLITNLDITGKWSLTSIEIPVHLRAELMSDLSVYTGTRLSTVISKSCTMQEVLTSIGIQLNEACGGVSTLTTPLVLGIYYQFHLGYGVELYYQLALNNLIDNSSYSVKLNTVGLNFIFSL